MAVKIVRQPNKIALIGAPTSAAALCPGSEKAPAALRAAGIIEKLQAAGYEVTDYGDCAPRLFADDDEHKRARNLPEIVALLNDLKPRAELAVKSGALVLVLGGDCTQVIALITAARRYYRHVNLLWCDRDADLNTPATTPSGRLDGMALATILGRGSAELVRFSGEPPLVREPDAVLFGITRLDPGEEEYLSRAPVRHEYAADAQAKGVDKVAEETLARVHADTREYVLHFDTDVIAQGDFPATSVPGDDGFRLEEVRTALTQFVASKNLLAMDISEYNPDKDPDGSGARILVELLADVLGKRLAALNPIPAETAGVSEPSSPEDLKPA